MTRPQRQQNRREAAGAYRGGTGRGWVAQMSTWVLRRAGTTRLILTAAGAWLAATGTLPARFAAIAGLLTACGCAALLLTSRVRDSPRQQLCGWLLSTVMLAACASSLVGAARLIQPTEPTAFTGEAVVAAESQQTKSGRFRTEIRTEHGPVTALSGAALPPAGSTVELRAELEPSGAQTVAFIRGKPQVREPPGPGWQLRAHLRSFLATASGTAHDGARLLPGLVIGDVSQIGDALSEDMRTVSLSHVTAVSGANITIVSLAVLWSTAFVLRNRVLRIAAAVAVTAGYVFIVGPEPSVTRAAAMGLVGAIALLRGTRSLSIALLASGIIGVLIHRPGLSESVGFHLSVSATAALIVLGRPLSSRLTAWGLPRLVADALAVPIAAQVGVTPVLLGIDGTLSAWSVPANALAAPAVAPATLLGMLVLACGVLPFGAWIAAVLVAPANWCAWWIARLAGVFADLPASQLPWPVGLLGIGLSCVVLVGLCLLVVEQRTVRRIGGVLMITACAAGLLVPGIRVPVSADWAVMFCDVGQGSATIVALPGDEALVIDTGEADDRIDHCLDRTETQRVHLMISHFDIDHFGGFAGTTEGRDVAAVYFPAGAESDPGLAEVTAALPGVQLIPAHAGQDFQFGAVRWSALWPPPAVGAGAARQALADPNSRSLVVRVELPALSVIAPGDIGAAEQRRLAATIGRADVLAAPHHGSGNIDERFHQAAGAQLGIVSVGADNTYGHPTTRALAAFGAGPVLRTDVCGSIVIDADRQVSSECQDFVLPEPTVDD